jgi:glycosyltransferase involved in cell wall biosynthesis
LWSEIIVQQIGKLNLVVGIATAGRREVLSATIAHLANQSRLPDALIVCPASADDLDGGKLEQFPGPSAVVVGPRGLCAQRNAILDAASDADVIVFFDDDFLPANSFLETVERLFTEHQEIVVATGKVLADGIHGPGISLKDGLDILAADTPPSAGKAEMTPVYNAYGCNMVIRLAPVRAGRVRFDETLPIYGWQEDVDFCRGLARHGAIVNYTGLRGVHLGTKGGRVSGVRFGYSQIANPLYLVRKGTVSWRWALNLMSRNCAANLAGSLTPPRLVDRRGRLKGNLMGFHDLVTGRLTPTRILSLK